MSHFLQSAIQNADDDLRPEDFYFEGPHLVFTSAYHLRRGFCCNSGCRHCPYGQELGEDTTLDLSSDATAAPKPE